MNKAGDMLICFSTSKENVVRIPEGTVEFNQDCMSFEKNTMI